MTLMRTIDGKRIIEINWIDSNLKMACAAEDDGDNRKAEFYLMKALNPESDGCYSDDMVVCEWCGAVTRLIEVHGHYSCLSCHRNVRPCCEGEVAGNE